MRDGNITIASIYYHLYHTIALSYHDINITIIISIYNSYINHIIIINNIITFIIMSYHISLCAISLLVTMILAHGIDKGWLPPHDTTTL